jgi:hypothetical protein
VLELDLAAQSNEYHMLRPVLATLAHAHGQGMPASVLARVAYAFAAGSHTLSAQLPDLRRILNAGRFYLRQATDDDGATLYRLFHQGLADYLRTTALNLGPFCSR